MENSGLDSGSQLPQGSIEASVGPETDSSSKKQPAIRQPSPFLDRLIERIDGCAELVEDELAKYQVADPGKDASPRTDYRLSVVIPVFNELNTIGRILTRVAALPLNLELVIVDDFSTDGTREVLSKLVGLDHVQVILKETNAGKGAALRTAFAAATGDFIVVQDADLEYDPCDIPQLIQPLLKGDADIVYGSRFIGEEQQDDSWVHRAGNAVLTQASNLFSGLNLTDMETCYKAFTREVLKDVELQQNRFGIERQITAKLARRGYQFVELPNSYESRGYDEGKKIGIKDLINAIYCIGRYGISD